ncbi:MAG: cobalamin-dependent protein [Pirellulaceae bacterium]
MSSRNVLLVNTNRMRPAIGPLALDYIGAALRSAGWQVSILDLCWAEEPAKDISSALGSERPVAVAVTFRNTDDCYYASGRSFVGILRDDIQRIRHTYDGPVIVGGCGFSTMPRLLLDHVGAEFGVRGDGEIALLQFLRALHGNETMENVPGLIYRSGGAWRDNGLAVSDLSAFDLSDRNVVDNRRYFATGGQAGIETKRGCPHSCIYCAEPVVKGRKSRLRAPAEIVREVRGLLSRGIDCFHTCDSEFNVPISHAFAVCEALIDAGLGDRISWYAYATPSPFPPELGASMKRAGCVGIDFGVDSGCDRILTALQRHFDASCLASTANACRRYGIAFMYDLLLGGPNETRQTVAATIDQIKRVSPDCVGISLGVRIYGGTPLAKQLGPGIQEGIVGDPNGLQPYFYMSPKLGEDPEGLVRDLIGHDPRFFLPGGGDNQDYNYNDNQLLERAIGDGYRGAYWDILRKFHQGE